MQRQQRGVAAVRAVLVVSGDQVHHMCTRQLLAGLSCFTSYRSVDFEDLFFPELFELVGQDLMPIHSHLM